MHVESKEHYAGSNEEASFVDRRTFELEARADDEPLQEPESTWSKRLLCWIGVTFIASVASFVMLARGSWKGMLGGGALGNIGSTGTWKTQESSGEEEGKIGLGSADVPGVDVATYHPSEILLSGLPDCRGTDDEVCTWALQGGSGLETSQFLQRSRISCGLYGKYTHKPSFRK